MLTIVLGATTVICAVGWLVRWVACAALAKYMIDKGYTPPTDEESKACALYVWTVSYTHLPGIVEGAGRTHP